MATKMEWGKFGPQKTFNNAGGAATATPPKPRRPLAFIQLGKKAMGKTYTLRLLGNAVVYYKYIIQNENNEWRFAITEDPATCPVAAKHNVKPNETFAVNVLDRADGQVKILEGPREIFEVFQQYQKMTEKNPGGPNGADFTVTVTGKKGKDYYKTEMVKRTPFTEAEKELLTKDGMFNLERIFKATPPDKIEDYLYGAGRPKNTYGQKPAATQPAKTVGASVGNSDALEEESSDNVGDSESLETGDDIPF